MFYQIIFSNVTQTFSQTFFFAFHTANSTNKLSDSAEK